jgi:hypothetical protein
MAPWERHRSILREAMIETFVAQRIAEPEDWFRKVPLYQRSGTNPVEKARYLDRICDLVGRLDTSRGRPAEVSPVEPSAVPDPPAGLAEEPAEPPSPSLEAAPAAPAGDALSPDPGAAEARAEPGAARPYAPAYVSASGFKPDPGRFYEPGYLPALRAMVAQVITAEGPIYAEQLVTRIARAHGFLRNGGAIVEAVRNAVEPRFKTTSEDGREVYWPEGADTAALHPLRRGDAATRDHFDVPLAELASLAAPLLADGRGDEEIVAAMRDHFGLGRLRWAARQRFEAAIALARQQA